MFAEITTDQVTRLVVIIASSIGSLFLVIKGLMSLVEKLSGKQIEARFTDINHRFDSVNEKLNIHSGQHEVAIREHIVILSMLNFMVGKTKKLDINYDIIDGLRQTVNESIKDEDKK